MARGRKKDLTIPPSRSLDHQRAYRDRKAKYVADLEERCRRSEAENEALRRELSVLKAGRGEGEPEEKRRMVRPIVFTYFLTYCVGGLIDIDIGFFSFVYMIARGVCGPYAAFSADDGIVGEVPGAGFRQRQLIPNDSFVA